MVVGPPGVLATVVFVAGVEEEAEVDADLEVGGPRVGGEEHGQDEEAVRLEFKLSHIYYTANRL